MRRMACVSTPALPLQLLLRREPSWHATPVAVLEADRPQGRILWVNEKARAYRILPGMSYAAGLSLTGKLRAAEVASSEIEAATVAVIARLQRFSPRVERSGETGLSCPGTFWLNASGLELLYESLVDWGERLRATLREHERLDSTVVVGFTRFGSYAVAQSIAASGAENERLRVFRSPDEESEAMRAVPLERLTLSPGTRDTFAKLGVLTAGDFAALPPEGIERRFGKETLALHRLARGELGEPLDAEPLRVPLCRRMHLETGSADMDRIIQLFARMLEPLLEQLAERGEMLRELELGFRFENGQGHGERLRPAEPTRDVKQIMDLVSLRLASVRVPDLVSDLSLEAIGRKTEFEQLDLFTERPPRDLAAANRALARLRAEFGESAVLRVRLQEAHLPEGRFRWEKLDRLEAGGGESRAEPPGDGVFIRRLFAPPIVLPARPRHEPDGWMLRGLQQGPVMRVHGPHIIAGGWWRAAHSGVQREYFWAETQRGELLWVYYDRSRRRWFLQGRLE